MFVLRMMQQPLLSNPSCQHFYLLWTSRIGLRGIVGEFRRAEEIAFDYLLRPSAFASHLSTQQCVKSGFRITLHLAPAATIFLTNHPSP
jgi:hypothetical protein